MFVSSDSDQSSFEDYYASHPWVAVPFGSKEVEGSNGLPGVGGIPTLMVLNGADGSFMTDEARGDIDPDAISFWDPEELAAKAAKKAEKKAEIMQRGQVLWDAGFAKMDKNGNGVLEKDEIGAVLKKILPDMVPPGAPIDEIMEQQLDAIMEAAGSDSGGPISKEAGWKFMTEQVFDGVEDQPSGKVDQLIGTIEEFIQNME